MSQDKISAEDRELLKQAEQKPAASEKPVTAPEKPVTRKRVEPKNAGQERGLLSPVQHDDDGWGDTPVQMRG